MSRSEGQRCLGDCPPRLIPTLLRLGGELGGEETASQGADERTSIQPPSGRTV